MQASVLWTVSQSSDTASDCLIHTMASVPSKTAPLLLQTLQTRLQRHTGNVEVNYSQKYYKETTGPYACKTKTNKKRTLPGRHKKIHLQENIFSTKRLLYNIQKKQLFSVPALQMPTERNKRYKQAKKDDAFKGTQ